MIYTRDDVINEMSRYFTEDIEGNNTDIIQNTKRLIDKILAEKDIDIACDILRDGIIDLQIGGKEVYKAKKYLPLWVRYLVYLMIYQYLSNTKKPEYSQGYLLKEKLGLTADIFGKKHWNMYSPDMKIRQLKYDCLKLPFNHAEVEANEIFRAMIHHMVCYSKILTDTFVDMNGKLGLIPALCANGYDSAKTFVSEENYKLLLIFVYALQKQLWVCKELKEIKYAIMHSNNSLNKVEEFIDITVRREFLIRSLSIETIHNNLFNGLPFGFDVYKFAALFILQQYFVTEYWMDSKLKTVQLENDENETIQYLTNELRSNITINRVKDFLNDDYEESIKQLSKLYYAKRFSINLNEFKEEIQELYDNIIDICDDTADIISYDSFIKNSNNALLFIDVPKYLREEKRFDFNFEWYKKLFSVLSIYYGDWILSWKNFVELNKKKNSLYSESRTGDKTIPIEIYAYGVSRDDAEKAGIKQSEGVTEQNQDDTKPEEYESSVNNMRSLYDDLAKISRNRQLYVYRYRDEDRNKPNSIIFITTIDFMEISDADFQKRYKIDFYTSGYGLGDYKYLKKYRYEDFYTDVKKTIGQFL